MNGGVGWYLLGEGPRGEPRGKGCRSWPTKADRHCHEANWKIATPAIPDKEATIDPTSANTSPFQSSKSPISSPPKYQTLGSARRRKTKPVDGMFSARNSGNHERLEGGHGLGWPTVGRNSTWNKFAVGAVALSSLFLVRRWDISRYECLERGY